MRKFLITYSYSNGICSGFGNVYRQHPEDEPMTESDVRDVANHIAESIHPGSSIVVMGFYELEQE